MIHLRTRNEILDYIEENAPRGSIAIAMISGTVEFLGGFSPLSPSPHGGFLIRVISRQKDGPTWHVAVTGERHGWKVWELTSPIPWKHWLGKTALMFAGDNPKEYIKLKERLNDVSNS